MSANAHLLLFVTFWGFYSLLTNVKSQHILLYATTLFSAVILKQILTDWPTRNAYMHSHVNSPGLHLMMNPVCFIFLHFKHLLNPPNPPVSTRTLFSLFWQERVKPLSLSFKCLVNRIWWTKALWSRKHKCGEHWWASFLLPRRRRKELLSETSSPLHLTRLLSVCRLSVDGSSIILQVWWDYASHFESWLVWTLHSNVFVS